MSTNNLPCALCGCQCNKQPPAFEPQGNELAFILGELKKLDNIIRTIKSPHLRRLNAIRSSTAVFPNEILLHIFQFLCSPIEPGHRPNGCPQITLSAVSSHWRDLVRSAPHLWEALSVKIRRKDMESIVSSLQTYLDNHGALLSSIQID